MEKPAILTQLGDRLRREAMLQDEILEHEDRNIAAIAQPKLRVGIDVDLIEVDAERAQLARHLLAEMAAAAAVKPSLCQ